MQSAEQFKQISKVLAPADAVLAIGALRQDATIWRALAQNNLLEKALTRPERTLSNWSPASLGLLALDLPVSAASLREEPLIALDPNLQGRAVQAFDLLFSTGQAPDGFLSAILTALALRERFRLSGSWKGQLDLTAASAGKDEDDIWATTIACLSGLLPDPAGLYKGLFSKQNKVEGAYWACHSILCTPVSEDSRLEAMLSILLHLRPEEQLVWLKMFEMRGFANLAARAAQTLLTAGLPVFAGIESKVQPHEMDHSIAPVRVARLQQLATLNQLAGSQPQAFSLLKDAEELLQYNLADIQVQIAGLSDEKVKNLKIDASRLSIVKAVAASPRVQTNLILGAGSQEIAGELSPLFPENCQHPFYLLRMAQSCAGKGDFPRAQDFARQALPQLIGSLKNISPAWARSAFTWKPNEILMQYAALDLPDEACQCADALLTWRPSDLDLLASASLVYQKAGKSVQAVELANLGVMLSPESSAARRRLADLYESGQDWEKALDEREAVLKVETEPTNQYSLDMARCAFRVGQNERALKTCQDVLDREPDFGAAHALLGQIWLARENEQEAALHLNRATILSPDDPQPWLSLAKIYAESGAAQKSLETLRAAVLAVPASAELNFELGKTYLENGTPSQALPFLKEASRLDNHSPEITWHLGKTMAHLGHTIEACQILEDARQQWPQHPMVAVTEAEVLIECGDQELALPALEVALVAENPQPEWYLLYAKALLRSEPDQKIDQTAPLDEARLDKAQLALRTLLHLQPGHFEAGILLAETLFVQKSIKESYEQYRQLVDQPEAARSEWLWRVQAGLGQTALALGEVETAVAALQESTHAQPENIGLHRFLTKAYRYANLDDDAVQAAHRALQLASDSLPNLTWFIETMKEMGREQDTIEALTTATEIAPDRADFWNMLARVQLSQGDLTEARSCLSSLTELNNLETAQLCDAACTYLRLGDGQKALACLDQAVKAEQEPTAALYFQIAGLRRQLDSSETALDAVQKAIEAAPDESALQIFQADLLAELDQPQAAMASLERALRQVENHPENLEAGKRALPVGWLPDDWYKSLYSPAAFYTRLALLQRNSGNMAGASQNARKALDLQPGNMGLRYLAADLARVLLDNMKAVEIAQGLTLSENLEDDQCNDQNWEKALYALQAELCLENGEDTRAAALMEEGVSALPEEPRFLAIQARLLARMGDLQGAGTAYTSALAKIKPGMIGSGRLLEYETIFSWPDRLFLSEAALDLDQWDEASRNFEQYAVENPNEARSHVRLARALVLSAERRHLCESLKCKAHSPREEAIGVQSADKFERAIAAAARMSNSVEITIWQARGRAVFQPGLQHAPAVAKLPDPGMHAPALLAVLRHSKNAENAIRIAHHYPESAEILLQLALCYSGINPNKGLDAARLAVRKDPNLPLNHVALAMLAEESGLIPEALQSLQTALNLWPDEPEWHAWAAELSQKVGELRPAITHWEQCLDLEPESLAALLALGRLYLMTNQAEKAGEVLEEAAQRDPKCAETWILLAQAERMDGNLSEALESTGQASQIDPEAVAPHLLSGEIALQMGKVDLALEHARDAIGCQAEDPAAVLFLSRVLVQKGLLSEGLMVIENALPCLKGSQAVLLERANLIRRLYGPQAALPVFTELSEIFPQEAGILCLLAQTQADCSDLKAAERTAYAAYHLNPDLPQLNFLLGRLQHSAGQLDQAIHFLSEAIRQSPADIDPYLELGQAYLERREHLQALRTYQQAIKIAPRDYRPFYQAASVMRDSKDYTGAELMLRRAVDLAPEDLNIRRQLGAVVALNLVHNSQEANSVL